MHLLVQSPNQIHNLRPSNAKKLLSIVAIFRHGPWYIKLVKYHMSLFWDKSLRARKSGNGKKCQNGTKLLKYKEGQTLYPR